MGQRPKALMTAFVEEREGPPAHPLAIGPGSVAPTDAGADRDFRVGEGQLVSPEADDPILTSVRRCDRVGRGSLAEKWRETGSRQSEVA